MTAQRNVEPAVGEQTASHHPPAAPGLPPEGRAALRAGVVGNYVDNIHMFLPLVALTPALPALVGPEMVDSVNSAVGVGALVLVAMLLGRPLGGVLFGRLSDKIGRSATTRIALWGTVACAVGIAVLPTYQVVGGASIVAIVVLRFLGGVCIAGEYSAAIPLAMEWSEPRRRGVMSGLILSMAAWAQGSIAFVTAILLAALGPDAYASWGWRALFLAGAAASCGMILYYRSHVADSPAFHKQSPEARTQPRAVRTLLAGRWRRAFWQSFAMMSGLWLLTTATVLTLPGQIASHGVLDAGEVAWVMGCASVGQALAMAAAGHLATVVGRRRLLMAWGFLGLVLAPWLWLTAVRADAVFLAAGAAVALQVVTVAAYGPVAAYLSERFPTQVRSTAYGMVYSWSLMLPALYPFWLPVVGQIMGMHAALVAVLLAGAGLLILGAALGPSLLPTELTALDESDGGRCEI